MNEANISNADAERPRFSRIWFSGSRAGVIVLVCVLSGAAFACGWWRVGGGSLVALALAMLPCGIACALGLCMLDRRKGTMSHCDGPDARPTR